MVLVILILVVETIIIHYKFGNNPRVIFHNDRQLSYSFSYTVPHNTGA